MARGGYDTEDMTRTLRDCDVIARTLEDIDDRCMVADGPVTPTLSEATHEELRRIYKAAKRIQARYAMPTARDLASAPRKGRKAKQRPTP